ncbi:Tm-1-like ATP-binding domain-containing protein [Rhizobium lentis]|uniref:Tm-1-like ATP-binding domain-containing protein n=1 Tax=Rhizobium lentis TaxID=1138194 RepID=UPI001C8375EE|nr:Tm-1-like ATP-binding domain-containing protein [Rhizobium lentis]MBX5041302.1 Tm-1-like ATP-binding domain-containing protein [Rhizobium lentis]MBX5071558.1 Tm-1-like ATP-binding domain-containing protein [Rhizobium lentis]MBX5108404.1 Tm-1-like ATP-binding domain-containing protein [Rhizobium lentis]MBX5117360.1 Tm-1-like ATP-binding domain-containing protein [Rhizobium lentis]MBX5133399.1 Tm-1-like ATP-binding domain-containing protein [Rhizobium lentis]
MSATKTILVIGTYDTKDQELNYVADCIRKLGGNVISMDVSVLGDPSRPTDISKHQVAAAAGKTIDDAINAEDENYAMQIMASGASTLCTKLYAEGRIHGMIALGGTMGTDLALDCARALPIGVPKYVVSTIAFSPLIAPDRLSADIQMILWAGGLYGLNDICKATLSQAAGAVYGAALAVEPPDPDRPVIGMVSFGSSALHYMVHLRQPLIDRGFSVAVFHGTGMGGMALESLAAQGYFAAVLELAVAEIGNLMVGSVVNAGANRMTAAGRLGTPIIAAPAFGDMIDFATWQPVPERFRNRPYHAHNRLLASASLTGEERRELAREVARRLQQSKGPVHFVLPTQGIHAWDVEGMPAHDPEALAEMVDEYKKVMVNPVELSVLDCHINDLAFSEKVLEIIDGWIADGTIKTTR